MSAVRPQRRIFTPVRRPPVGAPPGTLHTPPTAEPTSIRVMAYDQERLVEEAVPDAEALAALVGRHRVVWIDVQGLADLDTLRSLGETFGLHDLALEDIVHVHQRPKVEAYPDHLFIVLRIPRALDSLTEQVALVLAEGLVITFQERKGDCFEPVRERLRAARGRIRRQDADYLAYALIDTAIDAYFPMLERYGEAVEELEHAVMADPEVATIGRVHRLKRELLELRRSIWPHRELVAALMRDETHFVDPALHTYLRDTHDHTIQLLDILETYRETAMGLVDIYLSSASARLNEVMKVLTVIATIFIPLGFIAGVYGMNFDPEVSPWNMPELGWAYGYPFALGLMLITALALLGWFRRRHWL
jgi:magnesium transporter